MKALILRTSFGAMLGAGLTLVAVAQDARPPVTLKVGDKAPALKPAQWIKGTPTVLTDGKVHVVEFWATWCPPCNASIPILTRLAKDYAGQVVVTGIGVMEVGYGGDRSQDYMPIVRAFVKRQGNRMDYTVGEDGPDGGVCSSWLSASGNYGIPTAFIIDRAGKIVWIGNPLGMEKWLDLIARDRYDPAEYSRELHSAAKYRLATVTAFQELEKKGDAAGMLAMLPRMPKGTDLFTLPAIYEAFISKDSVAAGRICDDAWQHKGQDNFLMTNMARSILAKQDKAHYGLALRMVELAVSRLDPANEEFPFTIELLASAYEKNREFKPAVEAELRAIEAIDDFKVKDFSAEKKDALKTLARYKSEAAVAMKS